MIKTIKVAAIWAVGLIAPVIASVYLDRKTLDSIFTGVMGWLGESIALDRWLVLVVIVVLATGVALMLRREPQVASTEEAKERPPEFSSAEALILHKLYSLPLSTWYSPKDAMQHLGVEGEQEAQAVLEKLHRMQLVLRKRYTSVGFPQYRLSPAGRELMAGGADQVPVPLSALSGRHLLVLKLIQGFADNKMLPTIIAISGGAPFPAADAKLVVDELCAMRLLETATAPLGLFYKLTARGSQLCKELDASQAQPLR